jgi:ribose-phosphate pyrophosphokinase
MKSIIFFLDDNKRLKNDIITNLSSQEVDIQLGELNHQVFSDNERCVDYISSVRSKRVYIVSSPNTSDKIMDLMLAMDAAKRASAKEIIPVLPYFPYSRQDKKDQNRGPIGAKILAEMVENRGASQVVLFDLHAEQIQSFFNIPVTHIRGKDVFDRYIENIKSDKILLCAPDAGAAKRVKGFVDKIGGVNFIVMDKTRKKANEVHDMIVLGDVEGYDVVIIDDLCDTGGTLVKAGEKLLREGATSVRALVSHGVLSGPAYDRLNNSPFLEFVCSDSLIIKTSEKIKTFSVSKQIVNVIKSINEETSYERIKN